MTFAKAREKGSVTQDTSAPDSLLNLGVPAIWRGRGGLDSVICVGAIHLILVAIRRLRRPSHLWLRDVALLDVSSPRRVRATGGGEESRVLDGVRPDMVPAVAPDDSEDEKDGGIYEYYTEEKRLVVD